MTAARKSFNVLANIGPVLLITLGLLWIVQGALAHAKGHGVVVRDATFDAGVVKPGTVITHSVRVINFSAQPIQVDAQPSCGCTLVDNSSTTIGPLHSATIKAQIDTEGMPSEPQQKKVVVLQMQSGKQAWQQMETIKFRLQQ